MVEFLEIIFFVFLLKNIHCYSIYSKLPEVYGENNYSHFKFNHIKVICNDRIKLCESNNTNVCAVRAVNESMEYKDFENSCILFLSNMCDYPGEEYNILEGGTCEMYLKARAQARAQRRSEGMNATTTTNRNMAENTTLPSPNATTTPAADLRGGSHVSAIYDIDTAFDFHVCPLTCPETYSPVCVSANRGSGKYFKFFTFVNHCKGDVYYCKHFDEFGPPPYEEEENVNSSPLSWSYCGAFRYTAEGAPIQQTYMQFARFSEVLSSMSHYGWLVGDDRYSRIIPHERRPK